MSDLAPDDLAFFSSLTTNGGTGALFGNGQLSGYYQHFERLAAALPAFVAASRERDQLRAQVMELEGIAHEFDLASTRADALLVEVGALREEVERLRGLARKAIASCENRPDQQPAYRRWIEQMHDEIERKP